MPQKMHIRFPANWRHERGTNLVEFALVLFIFLSLLLIIVAFGQALSAYHFVDNASREATRFAIVRGSTCTRLSGGCPADSSDIQNYVEKIGAGTGINIKNLHVNTTWNPNNDPGSTVQVRVSYDDSLFFGFLPTTTITLSSTSQMVISQ